MRNDEGRTPLHLAAASSNVVALEFMAMHVHGPDLNAVDSRRQTPLHIAASMVSVLALLCLRV